MKRQSIFPGVLFIGIGLYYLSQTLNLPFSEQLMNWQIILIVIGVAMMIQGFIAREGNMLFPGVLLLGLGVHFYFVNKLTIWPDSWGMYTLILSAAYLVTYYKTKKTGLIPGLILLAISIIELLYTGLEIWLTTTFSFVGKFWPLALIAIGIYLVTKKSKEQQLLTFL
ncbi:LiaI-LiaF-like domain-containing protein [Pseudalkalibacillus sp. NRS-1564]|uniref:LiaI-LiaF-like domain-containing protein n=1 Tax=Pseudalkalibacillus sp. NRS-1564 TaxID=3233900 RepID=UPI003D2CE373